MWTQPQTEAEKKYFSKHAPKRRIFGIIQSVLQILHGFLALSAWYAVFAWAFAKVPVLLPAAPWLAAILLLVFHALFRVTWSTYWYDKLDDKEETDSSIWLPLIIIAVLLITEAEGAKRFLQQQVTPAEIQNTKQIEDDHNAIIANQDKLYRQKVADIERVYSEKTKAASLPYNNRISSLRKRRIDDESERRSIYNQISVQEQRRDAALAPIAAAKATELEKALSTHSSSTDRIMARAEQATTTIIQRNQAEQSRFDEDISNAGHYGWIISALLMILIAALGYAVVRINVKSGILPKRNFTVLDAHGSVMERLSTAFGDAFNRQSLKLAVATHKALSPKSAITSFDGTVVARPGTYNTPAGVITPKNTPAPITDSENLQAAYQKIWLKLLQIQKHYPEYMPDQVVIKNELNKALTLNGTYANEPWEDDRLGK